MKPDKIIKGKYEGLDKMWRPAPTEKKDCEMYKSTTILEDVDITQVPKGELPMISNRVFKQGNFKEADDLIEKSYQSKIPPP